MIRVLRLVGAKDSYIARAFVRRFTLRALSGHSMRVGAAQDLMAAGRDILMIMNAGGWTSATMVARYVSGAQVNVWTLPRVER